MLLALGHSFALLTDNQKLLHINSNTLIINISKNYATYRGHVHAKQGTRQLWGNKLHITQSASGQLHTLTTYGTPAKTQITPKPGEAKVYGQAQTIYYLPQQNILRYHGHARMEQAGNIFKGEYFNYNTQERLITGPSTSKEQATILLPPYNQNKLLHHETSTHS